MASQLRSCDNWRKRYRALVLHNQVDVNHLPYTLYSEDLSFETKDLIVTATPYQPFITARQGLTKESTRLDKALLGGLENVGFKVDHEDSDG